MRVLIVYEEIPEATKFFVLEAEDEDIDRLRRCHGKFVNCDEGPDLDWLSERLEVAQVVKALEPLDLSGYDLLVHTGFVL